MGLQVGFHLGLCLPIRDPTPLEDHDGIFRVRFESHGPPFMQTIDCHTISFFNTTISLFVAIVIREMMHLDHDAPTGYIMHLTLGI